MNALTVLSVVALAACSSGQLFGYPGFHGYPGFYGYPGLIQGATPVIQTAASPITLKTVASHPVTFNTLNPVTYAAAPIAPIAPVAPVQTQYHAQDELGQYSFGFAGGPSSRVENRNAFGAVTGAYNYVDSDGQVQTVNYVADALGFRVSGTNLPVAPEAPVAAPLSAPVPVEDTPEVAAAKVAHEAAVAEASAASAVAPARRKRSVPAVAGFSPLTFSYGFSSPLTYSRPHVVGSPLQYTSAFGVPAYTQYAAATAPAYTQYAAATAPAFTQYAAATAPAFSTYAAGTPVVGYSSAAVTPRDATLLRVVNNPNHATSYQVQK